MRHPFDAVIIGAGPAGSAAAILLGRAGWSVALVEKEGFPRRKVCGECIAASNLPLLAALGLGHALDAGAGPELRQVALMRGEQQVVAPLPPAAHDRYRWGRALGRESLDMLLLAQARAAGVQVFQPWSFRDLRGARGRWRCDLRAPDSGATLSLTTAVVIDAHGSWEALPPDRAARRRFRSGSDLFAFKANFAGATLPEGTLPVLSLDGGYGGMVLAGGGVTTVACCIRSDRLDALRRASPGVSAGHVIETWLQRECAGVRTALQHAVRDGPWLAAGPINPGARVRADDGPFRIGNAAGEAHPLLGEGMSMALQSAGLLCAGLLYGPGDCRVPDETMQHDVGRQYTAAWRRAFAPRIRLAAAFAHASMHPSAGEWLMSLARLRPGLLTWGARWGGKVHSAADPAVFQQRAHQVQAA